MKFKFIIILIIFLFSITCVSASENSTDVDDINVTFNEYVWEGNLTDINVELPENAKGNFSVKINDEVIYNEVITNKTFKVPVKLPKDNSLFIMNIYPPLDSKTYKVNAFYNGIDLNISKTLKVMKYSQNISNLLNFPEEILFKSNNPNFIIFPRSACGDVELYVDNKLFTKTKISSPFFFIDSKINNLKLGIHKLTVSYLGDNYYMPFNKTFDFNVCDALIHIPKTINIGHDDCVSVNVLKTTQGYVSVFLDSKLICKQKINNGDFILSLEDYLKHDSREVTVTFTNNEFTRSKTQQIDIIYDFDVFIQNFIYGENNSVEITLPDNLNNKLLKVKIDGIEYAFTHPSYIMNNIIELDISKLDSGNHTLFISYPGDDKFISKNKTINFTVDYKVIVPYDVVFRDGSVIYLKLPKNAEGNLVVYLNNQLFTTSKLINGFTQIRVDSLTPDVYLINATYDGRDYNVSSTLGRLIVEPKISLTYRFTSGEDKFLTVSVPNNCKGYVVIDNHKIKIKNGIAKYSLRHFKSGEHEIYIDYYGDNGFNSSDYRVITVFKPKIKIIYAKLFKNGMHIKVKILNRKNNPISKFKLIFKINKKTYALKSDKKGIIILKKTMKLKNKKYILKIKSREVTISKKIKMQNLLKLKKIKVKKSYKNLTLTATLKFDIKNVSGKKITFKFNGKKLSQKTDKKGIAKVIVNKKLFNTIHVGNKITYGAYYAKNSVTKTAIIEK